MTVRIHLLRDGRRVHAVHFVDQYGPVLSTHRTLRLAKKWCVRLGYDFFWAGDI